MFRKLGASRRLVVPVGSGVALGLCAVLLAGGGSYFWADPIIDIRRQLLQSYVDSIDEDSIQRAMINGMIDTLDDPYTEYIPPASEAEFNKELRGSYAGIGAEVQILDNYLTITSPMPGSPALEAGVMAGDTVVAIEGESTYKMPVGECIRRLTGEAGTAVTIKVRHLDGVEQSITLTRRQIVTQTVRGLRREGERWNYCVDGDRGIAYIHITQFNETTAGEFRAAVDAVGADHIKGLILDLRDDPGGALPAAIEMADMFLDEGVIVSVKDREGEGRSWDASPGDILPGVPLLVLTNQQSASASEIVSGSLQAHGRAKVLGMRTFGKGSVQEVRELKDKRGTLKLTVAHYYLASGRNIHRKRDSTVWGVDPDPGFVVRVPDEAYRETLRSRRDYEILRSGGNGAAATPSCMTSVWIRATLHDEQLARGVEAMQQRLSEGAWVPISDDDATLAAVEQRRTRLLTVRSRMLSQVGAVEQELAALNAPAQDGPTPLLPPDVDLIAGTITLRDRNQHVIGTFRIEGGDVEQALRHVDLSRIESQ